MSRFDDPVEAALERIDADKQVDDQFFGVLSGYKKTASTLVKGMFKQSVSPDPRAALKLIPDTVQAWKEESAVRTAENQEYLLNAVVQKVSAHGRLLDEHSDDLNRLDYAVQHSLAYVGSTSDGDRLNAFAAIAVSGAMVYRDDPLEQTEEFLRIASTLTNTDVMVLREMEETQSAATKHAVGANHILHQVQASWSVFLRKLYQANIQEWNYRSAFVRLQGVGFIERTEPNQSSNGLGETPYLVLELGKKFLQYLSTHNGQIRGTSGENR